MKKGDIVRHKTDSEALRIKRIGVSVVTCEEINRPKRRNVMGEYVFPVRICFIQNLETIGSQLSLI